ncbi:H-2 class II histocompatibility antigen, E-S beta chain-like isoform X3 [Pantherophis guttatus]|uniref:H-2 class II histocompatibility antigen, E-S beta chain-like isoform X3 n=1 Tax=Pantherophis guttatus TaxID=94885 RepID=A0ABM3ZCU2_PANGU|nr:H-2 class II histocompatibility antigen, E-S beta chain-like isoform X3 [Pantherophis guttatus]
MALAGLPLMLLVGALARIPGSEGGKETPAHFLHQMKSECHFLNGTQRLQFLARWFYDQQEFVRFDSNLGKFVAVTSLGQPDADKWNRDKFTLQIAKADVDRFCRHNYGVYNYEAPKREERVIGRRAKPSVSISPTKMEPSSPNTILLCTATGFYPVEIEIQWPKNGRPEEEGVAFGEELQNGDWTYQRQVMLETQPQRGDVYTCKVGHASLEAPITVQWEPRSSSSARSKLWTGIMGAVIGVAFLAVGLFSYLKSKKAIPIQPPAAKPTVSISPTKMEPSSPNTILLCTATGFYPMEIEVQWLKNGQPEEEGVAFGEELQNGDWTYQLQVMLETQPQRGDVYTCKVGHASLEAPITVQWEPRSSSSARSKLWTGIMGAVIGVAFLAVGLFSYLKSKKATPIQPPAALMN